MPRNSSSDSRVTLSFWTDDSPSSIAVPFFISAPPSAAAVQSSTADLVRVRYLPSLYERPMHLRDAASSSNTSRRAVKSVWLTWIRSRHQAFRLIAIRGYAGSGGWFKLSMSDPRDRMHVLGCSILLTARACLPALLPPSGKQASAPIAGSRPLECFARKGSGAFCPPDR